MVKFGNFTPQFKEGMQAYVDGKKSKDNPFPFQSDKWEDWKDGHGFMRAQAYGRLLLVEGEAITGPVGDHRKTQ